MPIYEYRCSKCGHGFELRRRMSESDSDIACPACGAMHPTRLLSVFATDSPGRGCAPTSPT